MSLGRAFPGWLWLAPAIGAVQLSAWLLLGAVSRRPFTGPALLMISAYGILGAVLFWVGRPQPAPSRLGGAFLLVAAAFADLSVLAGFGAGPLRALALVRTELFIPVFLWGLAEELPRRSRADAHRSGLGIRSTALLASVLLGAGLLEDLGVVTLPKAFADGLNGVRWLFIYVASIGALATMAVSSRRARVEERRRVRVFLAALLLGTIPAVLGSLALLLSPPMLAMILAEPSYVSAFRLVCYSGLATIPVATVYAVLVDRALGLRDIARLAVRSMLTRQLAFAVLLAPVAALIWLLSVQGRMAPPGGVLSIAALALIGVLGLLLLRSHARILAFVDRRFFSEHARTQTEIEKLEADVVGAASRSEVAAMVRVGLERAVAATRGAVLVVDPHRDALISLRGDVHPLPTPLAFGSGVATAIHLRDGRRGTEALDWSLEHGFELLIPFAAGSTRGAIAVGEKATELPFTREDERQLVGVAEAVGRTLERLAVGGGETAPAMTARDCPACGMVSDHPDCPTCGARTSSIPLPRVLGAKFELVRRIGAGGMGAVYAARDLDLERAVAIKMLPSLDGAGTAALRREARFMAGLSHPALATIHGIEIWWGRPALVLELLTGGSLADRLRSAPLPWQDAVSLMHGLALGVDHLHENQLLHGDIKPSNIGLSAGGAAKLLDFGLARILDGRSSQEERGGASTGSTVSHGGGTPAYLSPERIAGGAPDIASDLWALSLTLYEAISGHNPYATATPLATAGRILSMDVPDVRRRAPTCPDAVAALLVRALSRNPEERPGSARELAAELSDVVVGQVKNGAARPQSAGSVR